MLLIQIISLMEGLTPMSWRSGGWAWSFRRVVLTKHSGAGTRSIYLRIIKRMLSWAEWTHCSKQAISGTWRPHIRNQGGRLSMVQVVKFSAIMLVLKVASKFKICLGLSSQKGYKSLSRWLINMLQFIFEWVLTVFENYSMLKERLSLK